MARFFMKHETQRQEVSMTMTKFNKKERVVNEEGAPATKLSAEMALYNLVCTCLLQPKFYTPKAEENLAELRNLIRNNDATFVAKLAVYARNKMFLRTVPLVLLVELARNYSHNQILKKAVAQVINRPDEITELLACYAKANDRDNMKKLSCQLKKGIKLAANKFDAYQFAKWNKKGGMVNLKDALKLTRPIPKDDVQSDIFHKVCSDTLDVPYTWENEFCKLGRQVNAELVRYLRERFPIYTQSNKLHNLLTEIKDVHPDEYNKAVAYCNAYKNMAWKDKWEELIDSGRLPYQATLMNLRNILEFADIDHVRKAGRYLSSPDQVAKSKMFPFRYLSAHRALHNGDTNFDPAKLEAMDDALEAAVLESINNISLFLDDDAVLIACDVSSSMFAPVSKKSTVKRYDIGLLLGLLLKKKLPNSTIGIFGTEWKVKDGLEIMGALEGVNKLYDIEGEVGYATHGYKVLEYALKTEKKYDRIMIFTDGQMYNEYHDNPIPELWRMYKQANPEAKLYLFDLSGYIKQPLTVGSNDTYLIGGWSNEIFSVLRNLEDGKTALSNINNIEL